MLNDNKTITFLDLQLLLASSCDASGQFEDDHQSLDDNQEIAELCDEYGIE